MNILAIETATDNCSVALAIGDEHKQLSEHAPQQHARRLLPLIEQLLSEAGISRAQLDGVSYGQGPGSFTGLRIAAAAAQGIALGLDLPVAGVSTLGAVAHQRFRTERISQCVACLDARMSEVYWGFYSTLEAGASTLLGEERVAKPDELLALLKAREEEQTWDVSGTGVTLLGDCLDKQGLNVETAHCALGATVNPEALDILLLALSLFDSGDVLAADQALPVYLRDRVALTEKERKLK